MKYGIILQARMDSKRLPGKVLKKYKGLSLLKILIDKIKHLKMKNFLVVATTSKVNDKKIINFCKSNKVKYFIGSNNNVLKRYYLCAQKFKMENIIRLTADCPFLDIDLLKKMILIFKKNKYKYLANTYPLPCKYPDGSDIEIFSFLALRNAFLKAKLPSEKEHVTNYMYKFNSKKIKRIDPKKDLSKYRYTIDNKDDFKLFKVIVDKFKYNKILKLKVNQLVKFLDTNKEMTEYQKNLSRNYGWRTSLKKDKKYLSHQ